MLRAAFLVYVRVLLCLQGMYLVFLGVGDSFSSGLKHGIEALWVAVAAWAGYDSLMSWPPDWQFVWKLSAAGVLFLATVAGLLLRPVRAYTGLVRR